MLGLLLGCEKPIHNQGAEKPMNNKVKTLAERHSGYVGDVHQWTEFLSCWHEAYIVRHREILKESPDYPYLPTIEKDVLEPKNARQTQEMLEAIDQLEKRLGVALPKSYKDFLIAYQPTRLEPRAAPWGATRIGMYAPSLVDRLSVLEPEMVNIAKRYPIESSDSEYFVYGTEGDSLRGRTSYFPDAIVVGMYNVDSFELIVLYPQVRTADGEMEAALLENPGEFRAPSFAELMRQLSVLETKNADLMPPYSQQMLKGTCAEKLPLKDVWWK